MSRQAMSWLGTHDATRDLECSSALGPSEKGLAGLGEKVKGVILKVRSIE